MSTPSRGRLERCLCELEVEDLLPWARRRYGGGASTLDLIREAGDEREKECVACVAVMDMPEEELRKSVGDEATADRLIARRRELLEKLAAYGIEIPLRD